MSGPGRLLAGVTLAALALAATPAGAQEAGLLLTEQLQLGVADAFLERGEPYRAVTEYQRFLILFPGSPRATEARLGVGEASWRGEDYPAAAAAFAAAREVDPGGPRAAEAGFREGLAWWRAGRPERALPALDALAASARPGSPYPQRARAAGAVLALEGGDLAGARSRLDGLAGDPASPEGARARAALGLLERPLPAKSPALAGALSALLPGSGHAYAGRYGDAVTALAINGLLIAGAIAAARDDNWALAAVAIGVEVPFYAGNVYGAANAARKWNLAVRRGLRDEVAAALELRF